jgi:hypothetical protein
MQMVELWALGAVSTALNPEKEQVKVKVKL